MRLWVAGRGQPKGARGALRVVDEVRLCAGKVGAISRVRKQKDTLYATDVRDCREVRLPRSEIAAKCILVCICRTVCKIDTL